MFKFKLTDNLESHIHIIILHIMHKNKTLIASNHDWSTPNDINVRVYNIIDDTDTTDRIFKIYDSPYTYLLDSWVWKTIQSVVERNHKTQRLNIEFVYRIVNKR